VAYFNPVHVAELFQCLCRLPARTGFLQYPCMHDAWMDGSRQRIKTTGRHMAGTDSKVISL
jgi:hypothetical protein